MSEDDVAQRLADLERRVGELEERRAGRPEPLLDEDTFWALNGLRERLGEANGEVLFTGATNLPNGERYAWQQAADTDVLLDLDWADYAASFAALGHPVRLRLLRHVLGGARTVAELTELGEFGTTGQLYHHLKQLVAAGWLRAGGRGHYTVPGERVVPLFVQLAVVAQAPPPTTSRGGTP